jgi:pyridoxal 5'-phosphate synthase pdxT subunit
VSQPRVGVLALQGDVAEHVRVLADLGVTPVLVRTVENLEGVDALVLPGGESTTMIKLLKAFDLLEPLRSRVDQGLPAFGTCAGMILLADRIEAGAVGQETVGGIDITVRRNAFGRQVDSAETDVAFTGLDEAVHAVLIRAPWVEKAGDDVEVLARVEDGPAAGKIVAVRQGNLLATSFHPEVGDDDRVHRLFIETVVRPATAD